MSICIAIAVPDGIALAADSQTTWTETIVKAKDKATKKEIELLTPIVRPIGWSKMARKVFEIELAGKCYAVCTTGAATINKKTIHAIFKSLAKRCKLSNPEWDKVVDYLVNGIKTELKAEFKKEDLSSCPNKLLDFILCGFLEEDVAKPVIQEHHVFSGKLKHKGKLNESGHILSYDQRESHGGCWIGRAEFITHIINHKNKKLPPIAGQFHMMSLSDAKDYTKWLVEYTCDFQRFAMTVPDCARPVISAELTPEGYQEEII